MIAAGQNLIEDEKMAIGGVKWRIYAYYLKSIGILMGISAICLFLGYQV